MEKQQKICLKILSVCLGFVLGGFMWRCRGETGFGSFWGLCSVGLVLMLLVYNFYGSRKGMRYEMIPLGALMLGLGVNGYATVNQQMSGLLESDLPYQGAETYLPINPYSGMVIMLIMGFTFIPLFSLFIGTLFSKKEYNLLHYGAAAVLYFVISILCKTSISHYILKLINPEQVEYAALGLADSGYDYVSPMSAYLDHFLNRSWTQEIPFFENYFMSIDHISDTIAIIVILLLVLIVKKDFRTFIISFTMNIYTAVATTAASVLMLTDYSTGICADVETPCWLSSGAGWGIWEFATGASVGLITMLVLAFVPGLLDRFDAPDYSPLLKNKVLNTGFNIIATVFMFGVVPWRAIGMRLGKFLAYREITEKASPVSDIVLVAGSVLFGIWFIFIIIKNVKRGNTPIGVSPVYFSGVALPAYVCMCCVIYYCLNHGYIFILPYSEMTGISEFFTIMTDGKYFEFLLMAVAFILFVILYASARKILDKKRST